MTAPGSVELARKRRRSTPKRFLPRERSHTSRIVDSKELVPRYLIVCEGARTEPNYFKSFRVARLVRDGMRIAGTGYNTVRLIEEAVRLRAAEGPFDQTWCVFDTDSFPAEHVRDAVALAEAEDIRVACSNEAFELWYFLHYHYLESGITRQDYIDRLNHLLGTPYEKNRTDIYDLLFTRQALAIKHAKKLLANYPNYAPATDKPSTTVHQLVEELNRYLAP